MAPEPRPLHVGIAVLVAMALTGCEYKPPPGSLTAEAAYSGDIINSYVDTSTGYVIGGSIARQWVPASESVSRLNVRQSWWVYGVGRALGRVDSGPAQPAGSGCDGWRVKFLDLGPKTSDAFAIMGRWNGAPRKAEYQSLDHPAYMSLVSDTLAARGIDSADITLTANLRIDLDDDGIDEVLLSASNLPAGAAGAEPGSYSLVLLRKSAVSGVSTHLLNRTLLPDGCSNCEPAVHTVGGLVDLNGDGKVEIIIRTASASARGGTVYAAREAEPEEVLTWSCPDTG